MLTFRSSNQEDRLEEESCPSRNPLRKVSIGSLIGEGEIGKLRFSLWALKERHAKAKRKEKERKSSLWFGLKPKMGREIANVGLVDLK